MKLLSTLLALSWISNAQAGCSSNLLIDNYSNYANNLNSLGQWTSGELLEAALRSIYV